MAQETLTFSEKNKGWTSFWSYAPEWMGKLGKRFFTVHAGQLHMHNDENNPKRNFFYGVKHKSLITFVFNDEPRHDKIWKNIVKEGNATWSVALRTNLNESTIKRSEFNLRESRYFAYTRRDESGTDLRGHAAQGIGVIAGVSGNDILFSVVPNFVNTGNVLYQLNGGADEVIGTIINISGNIITVNAITTAPVVGFYSFCRKISRFEGAHLRGYYMEVTLDNDDETPVELFAVSTNAVKSGV